MNNELGQLKDKNRRLRELLAEHRIELPSELRATVPTGCATGPMRGYRVASEQRRFMPTVEGEKIFDFFRLLAIASVPHPCGKRVIEPLRPAKTTGRHEIVSTRRDN